MQASLTRQFLRSGGTLADLASRFSISAKRHHEHPNLVFLKYNQLTSLMAEPIVQECRGLILDEADNWAVVSHPFNKFFNHGEGHAAAIDWSTAKVYEKLDGSLMTLYWYKGQWRVASNGTPDAGGRVNGLSLTFAELFWRVWNEQRHVLPNAPQVDGHCSFMFELMTPYNRVVVQHKVSRLLLTGCRLINGKELDPTIVSEQFGWECVKSYPLNCIESVLSSCENIDPLEGEGYVVCDANFNRIKVKSPKYVALAHLKDTLSPRNMLDLIRRNESDEFLSYFPELSALHAEIYSRFAALCNALDDEYAHLAGIELQKEFAAKAVKSKCASALFAIRAKKATCSRAFFASCTLQCLERVIDLPNIQLPLSTDPERGQTELQPLNRELNTSAGASIGHELLQPLKSESKT